MELLACALLLLLTLVFLVSRRRRRPPGPPSLPVLGSIPFLDVSKGILDWILDPRVTDHKLATVDIGGTPFNVINDFDLAKDLFNREEFSGKDPNRYLLMLLPLLLLRLLLQLVVALPFLYSFLQFSADSPIP